MTRHTAPLYQVGAVSPEQLAREREAREKRAVSAPTGGRYRCSACGLLRVGDRLNAARPCSNHPDADLILWERRHVVALHYCLAAWGRGELGTFADTYDPALWPGTTAGDLALVSLWLERWGPPSDVHTPETAEPGGAVREARQCLSAR